MTKTKKQIIIESNEKFLTEIRDMIAENRKLIEATNKIIGEIK